MEEKRGAKGGERGLQPDQDSIVKYRKHLKSFSLNSSLRHAK